MRNNQNLVRMLRALPELQFKEEDKEALLARIKQIAVHDVRHEIKSHTRWMPQFRRWLLTGFALIAIIGGAYASGQAIRRATTIRVQAETRRLEELEWSPAEMVVSKSKKIAYLLARNGRAIRSFAASADGFIESATFVPADRSGGRGALAVLGFETRDELYPSQFVAYSIDEQPGIPQHEEPVWTSSISDDEIPGDLKARPGHEYHGNQFSARVCIAADVFPNHPGDELVVVFQHGPFSQCCVRILGADGRLLWGAFHDGNLVDARWMPAANQIVLLGVNGEVFGPERSLQDAPPMHPFVLLAVTPVQGQIAPQWINTVDHGGGIEPNWYRCLLNLPQRPIGTDARLTVPLPGLDPASNVAVTFDMPFPRGGATLTMTLNEAGEVVPNTWTTNHVYKDLQNAGLLPSPSTVKFGDLPPIQNRDGMWIPGSSPPSDKPGASRGITSGLMM